MSEVRQRWRLAFRRGEEARYLAHLDAVKLWERAFRRGRVPIATSEGFSPRPRLVFAAPLPLGMLAERELADLFLAERLTLPDLRDRLIRNLPLGYGLVDVHDVWVGEASLASRLVAADYRMVVSWGGERGASGEALDLEALRTAARQLMDAERLDREKKRSDKSIAYDLRPLLLDLQVLDDDVSAIEGDVRSPDPDRQGPTVRMRLRHAQDGGSARADEVVLALGEVLGRDLESTRAVRERLWLADEVPVRWTRIGGTSTGESGIGESGIGESV